MDTLRNVNLALRFLLELTALTSLGYGGWKLPRSLPAKLALAAALPSAAVVAWSLWVSPQAAYDVDSLRVLAELLVFGGAGLVLTRTGNTTATTALLITYAVNRALMATWDQ